MMFIIFIVWFHLMDWILFRVYTKDKHIDYENPTEFESIMWWPQIIWGAKQSKLRDHD